MFLVIKVKGADQFGQYTTPSAGAAREWAKRESFRHADAAYKVIRDGFGDPITWAYRGELFTNKDIVPHILRYPPDSLSVGARSGRCDRCNQEVNHVIRDPLGTYCPTCFYERMTAGELRSIADRAGISVPDRAGKSQLVAALVAAITNSQQKGPEANRMTGPQMTKG